MMSSIDNSQVSAWASSLFNRLDTQNQGYIDKSGLQSALNNISDDSASADDIFTRLDSDSDGKVTKDEMTSALQQLFAKAGSQADRMMMDGGAQEPRGPEGMPPPPPPNGKDTGFTKEELTSQLETIETTDSKRSTLISGIIENFDEADTDGDGKVSFSEARAYDKANQSTDSASVQSENRLKDDEMIRHIMKLIQAYQTSDSNAEKSNSTSQLSVTA